MSGDAASQLERAYRERADRNGLSDALMFEMALEGNAQTRRGLSGSEGAVYRPDCGESARAADYIGRYHLRVSAERGSTLRVRAWKPACAI